MNSSTPSRPSLTLQALSRRSVLMLFAAMAVALAAGLLAWGPVVLVSDTQRHTGTPGSVANYLHTLATVPMLLVGLWGWKAVRRSRWTPSVQRPWAWFFASVSLAGSMDALSTLAFLNDAGRVLAHAVAASGSSLLLLGFLAERVDARFGSIKACIGAAVTASIAALAWWIDAASLGSGDLRVLLLLTILPLLLIPAGALDLRGRYTSAADWLWLLSLYAIALMCGLADASILEWNGWVGGHTLMQLAMAGVAAWIALRCSSGRRATQGFGAFGDSSQRKASLYTSL
jgi:hypothetical protein